MDMLNILLTAFFLSLLFITPSLVKRRYIRKKYLAMLNEYREDYKERHNNNTNNVYKIEDYRKKIEDKRPDDIIKHSLTHILMWSEEQQEYVKIPKNSIQEDEEL
jgi:hypothetical protein